jgi:hypothetical protein
MPDNTGFEVSKPRSPINRTFKITICRAWNRRTNHNGITINWTYLHEVANIPRQGAGGRGNAVWRPPSEESPNLAYRIPAEEPLDGSDHKLSCRSYEFNSPDSWRIAFRSVSSARSSAVVGGLQCGRLRKQPRSRTPAKLPSLPAAPRALPQEKRAR